MVQTQTGMTRPNVSLQTRPQNWPRLGEASKVFLKASRPDDVRFGHGGSDHFHPHPPFQVYGKSNPFFKPLIQDLLKGKTTAFKGDKFAQAWILNPEIDGINNLKSLHLVLHPNTLAQTLESLSIFKRPKGLRISLLKAGATVCSIWPLTSVGKKLTRQHQAISQSVVNTMLEDLKKNRILPMLHFNIIANPLADRHIRGEAAKLLIWDFIGQYNPDTDHYAVNTHPEFGEFKLPDEQYDTKRWGRKLWDALSHMVQYEVQVAKDPKAIEALSKILAHYEYAWPHDAYEQAQAAPKPSAPPHDHDHDHDHGHSHAPAADKPAAQPHHHDHDHDHGHSHAPAADKPAAPPHHHDHDHDHGHSHAPAADKPAAQPHHHDHDHDHGHSHSHAPATDKPTAQPHHHDHDHDHGHGHSHAPAADKPAAGSGSAGGNGKVPNKPAAVKGAKAPQKMLTIHRTQDWDAPKRLAPALAAKLMVLPMSQPIRPLVTSLMGGPNPDNWAQQLFEKIVVAKQPASN